VFAPGFGAGAVGGYAVLRIDPAVVAPARDASADGDRRDAAPRASGNGDANSTAGSSPQDVYTAFGD